MEVGLYFECERRRKRVFECECEGPSASRTSCGGDDEHGVRRLGAVWYMCLKTENYCLKIFMKIRVGEKVR